MFMLEEVGSPDNAGAFLDEAIAAKRKVMGFGHREYKVKDPQAVILQALVEEMFDRFGHDDLYDVARAIEREAESRLGPKGIYPNVDFYSGLVYRKLGIPGICSPRCSPLRAWLAGWPTGGNSWVPTSIFDLHRFIPVPAALLGADGAARIVSGRLGLLALHSTPW